MLAVRDPRRRGGGADPHVPAAAGRLASRGAGGKVAKAASVPSVRRRGRRARPAGGGPEEVPDERFFTSRGIWQFRVAVKNFAETGVFSSARRLPESGKLPSAWLRAYPRTIGRRPGRSGTPLAGACPKAGPRRRPAESGSGSLAKGLAGASLDGTASRTRGMPSPASGRRGNRRSAGSGSCPVGRFAGVRCRFMITFHLRHEGSLAGRGFPGCTDRNEGPCNQPTLPVPPSLPVPPMLSVPPSLSCPSAVFCTAVISCPSAVVFCPSDVSGHAHASCPSDVSGPAHASGPADASRCSGTSFPYLPPA
jgi:hypothetical protein